MNEDVKIVEELGEESEKKGIITRSIRADAETFERIKEISKQFPNQAEALKQLVNLYELDSARAANPGSADMLDAFRNHLDGIQKAFIYSLELKESAEEIAQKAVASKMELKDKTIAGLQEDKEAQKAEIDRLKAEIKAKTESEANLAERVENAENAAKKAEIALSDKETIIEMQRSQLANLEDIKKAAVEDRERAEVLRSDLEGARIHIDELKRAKEDADRAKLELAERLDRENAEHEKAIDALTKNLARDIEVANERAENAKRAAVLEAKEAAFEKFEKKLEAKDEEIARLKAELVELKFTKEATQKPKKAEKTEQISLTDSEEVNF